MENQAKQKIEAQINSAKLMIASMQKSELSLWESIQSSMTKIDSINQELRLCSSTCPEEPILNARLNRVRRFLKQTLVEFEHQQTRRIEYEARLESLKLSMREGIEIVDRSELEVTRG